MKWMHLRLSAVHVKVRGGDRGSSAHCSDLSPAPIVWALLIESIKCYFMPKYCQISWVWNGYGVCSNLASSGAPPPPLHMTTLTTGWVYRIRRSRAARTPSGCELKRSSIVSSDDFTRPSWKTCERAWSYTSRTTAGELSTGQYTRRTFSECVSE